MSKRVKWLRQAKNLEQALMQLKIVEDVEQKEKVFVSTVVKRVTLTGHLCPEMQAVAKMADLTTFFVKMAIFMKITSWVEWS